MAEGSGVNERPQHPLTGWMIVAIVGIIAVAAVGITALVTQSSTNASAPTTIKAPVVQTTTTIAATTSTVAVTTTTSASLTNFVGTWTAHDGQLVIAANGGGTISVAGLTLRACGQAAQIQVSALSTTTAAATITSIDQLDQSGCPSGASGINPSGDGGINENLGVGSTITLTFEPPGVQTSMGVSYCDPSHEAQGVCGA